MKLANDRFEPRTRQHIFCHIIHEKTASSYCPLILHAPLNTDPLSPFANQNAHSHSCFFSVAPMGQSNSNHDSCFCGTRTICISHAMFTTASPSPYNFTQLILGHATRIPAMHSWRMHSNINKSAQNCSVPLETVIPKILGE